MNNKILKCFKNDGSECNLDECDYLQLELLGNHAKTNDAIALINKKCLIYVLMFKWYLGKDGYPIGYKLNNDIDFKNKIKLHQLVYRIFVGNIPDKYVIDHINRNKLDNRLEN